MSKSTKELLLATVNSRLPCLEQLLEENQQESNIKFEDMFFSRDYLHNMVRMLKDVAEGRDANYKAIYDGINLEMIANSQFWCEVRLHARRLC